MPRPSNRAKRREQIADGLKRVMARKGYDGATIGDIAAEAGLTAGLVHYHFKNKLEILLLVIERLSESHEATIASALEASTGDAVEEVSCFIDLHLAVGEGADPEAVAAWIVIGGEALRQEAVRERYGAALEALTKRLRAIIDGGTAAGDFDCKPDESDAAACALMATIQGYFTLAATARSLIPRGSAAEATRRMAEGLLKPKGPIKRSS
jgi:TetR/AcrR family transcriptional repressor of bet genes